jgi:peptide/nickel transport system permease protein
VISSVFLFTAIFGTQLVNYNPNIINLTDRLQPPSFQYPFGTDEMGRDLFKAVIAGANISLQVGLIILSISVTIGTLVGLIAGYVGGIVDNILMRITDVFLGFPPLILAMVVSVSLGGGIMPAVLGVAVVWWPGYARLVRAPTLLIKEMEYVVAARAIGASNTRIMFRHVLPGVISPLLVKIAADFGFAILATASLSFIGLGARPPSPEWGRLVIAGRNLLLDYWWYSTIPGAAIFVVVFGLNLLGDGLRDLLDPRGNRNY